LRWEYSEANRKYDRSANSIQVVHGATIGQSSPAASRAKPPSPGTH
jgi:hypothetical protein